MQQCTTGAENTYPWTLCWNSFLQSNYGLGAEPQIQRVFVVVIKHGPNFFNTPPVETRGLCLLPLNLAKAMTAPTNGVRQKCRYATSKASSWFSWKAHSLEPSQHPVWSPRHQGPHGSTWSAVPAKISLWLIPAQASNMWVKQLQMMVAPDVQVFPTLCSKGNHPCCAYLNFCPQHLWA